MMLPSHQVIAKKFKHNKWSTKVAGKAYAPTAGYNNVECQLLSKADIYNAMALASAFDQQTTSGIISAVNE